MGTKVHLNFIGHFELPAGFITPMELEEQARQAEEKAAKERQLLELNQERYERRKQEKREITARKNAGLLTPEELEAYKRHREKRNEYAKTY